ncbi:type II toxin-antitoxin system VapB family antitoxin [Actinoplanes sp. TFC3]|uniref:type II toxin-antitoxin system VapB family antitoxin n=1 Tax=Actinoplanes sp. TFC3 TaxID=1710355 RepID=UPI000832F046|nr:type II toxin-antitoxin system VapB family antitoxin [Actinoplanes sp. TFC3]
MTRSVIDIDERALAEVAMFLGTKTKKETVNTALREVARRAQQVRVLQGLAEMGSAGDFAVLRDKCAGAGYAVKGRDCQPS